MNLKEKLTMRKLFERFSYGCGDFGCNIIYTAMSAFLMYYYSDYAGVNTLAVGTIMLISRIFDGISDIIMGFIVDRTKSRFGKARPWLLRMCVPFAISGILLFSVPAGWTDAAKLVYVFVTYNLTSTVIYTAINVPYSSLNALMTQDPYERSVLSIFRNVLATCGTLLINVVTLPLVKFFGDNASAWTKAFAVLGILAIIAFLINFFGTEERVKPVAAKKGEIATVSIKDGILALFRNKYWIMMTLVLALFFLYYAINGGTTVYYAENILGNEDLVSTINGIYNAIQILCMFLIAKLVKRYGKRNVFSLGLILATIGMLILELGGGSMPIIVISSLIRGMGNACGGATMWAMVSDTIDYGEWKTGYRTEYEKPGPISIMEYDPGSKKVLGMPKRIWRGGTDRGCIEAPHLTKHGDYYYIMCAEGGTGYYHSVTMGRSKSVWGPYEPDPKNPIVTSNPVAKNERADWDHLKPRYYNPAIKLQKAGHGSYVDLPNGETWLVCHVSRPFIPELRCTLGRETAIQRMIWTTDGWLRMESGNNLAQEFVQPSSLPEVPMNKLPEHDDFDSQKLNIGYYAPRIDPNSFVDLTSRPGWARLRGQESGCSQNRASILVRKLTSVQATATTKLDFTPLSYQHTAGLILYYDNMNFLYLYKYYSETLNHAAISILQLENGVKREYHDKNSRIYVEDGKDVWMRVKIRGRDVQFEWSLNGENYSNIGPIFDISKLSDEYSQFGEFTGSFVGITCSDRMMHRHTADFDFFDYLADEHADVQ